MVRHKADDLSREPHMSSAHSDALLVHLDRVWKPRTRDEKS